MLIYFSEAFKWVPGGDLFKICLLGKALQVNFLDIKYITPVNNLVGQVISAECKAPIRSFLRRTRSVADLDKIALHKILIVPL